MLRKICKWLLYKRLGWEKNVTVSHPDKFIICLAPHTSNADFLLGQLYMRAEAMKINFLMKSEWFAWPLGTLFRKLGGIPVSRGRHTSMTDSLAATARRRPTFRLCVTPEGTPILLYGLDYERKLIQCTKSLTPSGDIDKDMRLIKDYFKGFTGRHPELFTTGE